MRTGSIGPLGLLMIYSEFHVKIHNNFFPWWQKGFEHKNNQRRERNKTTNRYINQKKPTPKSLPINPVNAWAGGGLFICQTGGDGESGRRCMDYLTACGDGETMLRSTEYRWLWNQLPAPVKQTRTLTWSCVKHTRMHVCTYCTAFTGCNTNLFSCMHTYMWTQNTHTLLDQ